jgi:hypothetical protein
MDNEDAWQAVRHNASLQEIVAEKDAEIERLRAVMAWTNEVRPGALPWGGANVEMTWEQFNAMRDAIGLKPQPVPAKRRRNAEQSGDKSDVAP